ncbi:SDR family oxidoreductase [Nocardioides sp. zg-DK7169]|uniref:SDR family oxidoreductase n=1 Tax=Nocardioides sp. zg-DK7169 TaxID=2736600 RepID=UPI0015553EF6|nr:SDR family NAD(P)-dependent oxidoreductase [Nocardioides sp. zg-DK7169]NPC97004.1 SDR family NAD(P)-dependent oxidoreductase [Nocardioides sp. zg-DK7169]
MRIHASTVFIPGATSGIGLALALRLRELGSTVVIGGRRGELLDQLAAEHPGLGTVQIDTADAKSIEAAAEEVLAAHPDLDVLVTMAGIMRAEDWTTPEGFLATAEATVTTNLLGPIRLVAAFIEHLRSRPEATIMTVSSGLAFVPLEVTPTYNATKAAVHQLTDSVRLQLAGTSVRMVELVPPAVRTGLMPGQETSDVAMPLEDFVAEVVALLEAHPDADEILVENVKPLRYAEARGVRAEVVASLNSRDPHARQR